MRDNTIDWFSLAAMPNGGPGTPSPVRRSQPFVTPLNVNAGESAMARIPLVEMNEMPSDVAEMIRTVEETTGDATALRALAHNPELLRKFVAFYWPAQTEGLLGRKLVELVRLAIAQINQCPNCLAGRYQDAFDEGLTEDLISKLPNAEGREEYTECEKAAIAYAQKMATDHRTVGDSDFARLYRYLSYAEVVELCMLVAQFVGIGRTLAVIDAMNTECRIESTPQSVGAG